ncbi:MAG: energy transducer TonB [Bacteroidia bacterium]
MKNLFICLFGTLIFNSLSAQFIAKMEVKGPLPGACDSTNVYALFSGFDGQVQPKCSITKEELELKLNAEVKFLLNNPKFKGKLMVSCIINCKGELIKCEIDNKSGNDELDNEVVKVFRSPQEWTAGTFNGNGVDCVMLYSMEVKKGKLKFS